MMLCYTASGRPMTPILDANALFQRGFELRCEGRYAEAKSELQKVLQVDPSHVDAKWQLGLIQGFEGDFDGSLATLEVLVRENPNHSDLRYDLAMTEMMLGMYEQACQNLR